jgi:hypothetical protein
MPFVHGLFCVSSQNCLFVARNIATSSVTSGPVHRGISEIHLSPLDCPSPAGPIQRKLDCKDTNAKEQYVANASVL